MTPQDLRDGLKDPSRWLTYAGDYTNQRHSPLTQITPENVHRLAPQWAFQTETLGRFQATPLVVDGIIYVTGPLDTGWALDARTGRQLWRYRRELPGGLIACCGLVNRGFGVLGDRLFKTTLDAHVVAISMKTGAIVWDTVMENYRNGYSGTAAPLVVKDKVIVGMAGAEYGVRGFIDAYDAQTGKRSWRFFTTAGPDDPGHGTWRGTDPKAWEKGGGSIWVTGAYDPELNLVYWGTGNAGPDYDGSAREGDNLYTASIVALDADTGRLRWHYQFTPHDVWDWDAIQMPVLADLTLGGQPRKVVMFANRNGFFYLLDRATGQLVRAKPFIETSWAKEIQANGRPLLLPNSIPSEEGTRDLSRSDWRNQLDGRRRSTRRSACCSSRRGNPAASSTRGRKTTTRATAIAAAPSSASVSPASCARSTWRPASGAGTFPTRASHGPACCRPPRDSCSPAPRATSWRSTRAREKTSGIFRRAPPCTSGAITYMVDGRQYVLMPSGTTLTAYALPASLATKDDVRDAKLAKSTKRSFRRVLRVLRAFVKSPAVYTAV